MLRRFVNVLLIVTVGQLLTVFIAQEGSKGAGLGVLMLYPLAILIGMSIQIVVIFITIKDNLIGKAFYVLLGILLSVIMIWVFTSLYGFIYSTTHSKQIKEQTLKNQASEYCYRQKEAFTQKSGFSLMDPYDPKRTQILQESDQQHEDCLKTHGYYGPNDIIPLPI